MRRRVPRRIRYHPLMRPPPLPLEPLLLMAVGALELPEVAEVDRVLEAALPLVTDRALQLRQLPEVDRVLE